ncbi:SDR family NAD(P)-dependent oxidoreductase [Brevibacillus nitrificans]|uniref:SDR family NAD(P)-dependent oxidoreductase n=1 Tax=Brevibacillus nitrificans TaxID=651560 RepID=A0A3M8D2I8_9BACL|nr:SDR family NAD(P)-dependent oxidoreductase [Brevibacillus nitrificans]RNB82123.1 SDR family NAD(P)-dependent oxidoreductase [Brevibacillus nitrificans]
MSKDVHVALVTGGNRGMGYELVKQLAMNGCKVLLASRDPGKGQVSVQRLKESNLDVSFLEMDVDK